MGPLQTAFGLSGRIERTAFAVGIAVAGAAFWSGIRGSEAALPLMAEVLAPRGINAGLALNMIWLALGLLLVWVLIALGSKRLRDTGRSPWWGVVVVVPLAALALANDAIFLVSKSFVVPRAVNWVVLIESTLIGLWVLAECLLRPSTRAARPLPAGIATPPKSGQPGKA